MTQRRRLLIAAIIVLGACFLFALPPVYWRIIGWGKGEAFFRDRPTSYWASRVRECWEESDWWCDNTEHLNWRELVKGTPGTSPAFVTGGDPAAIPVLKELVRHPDPRIVATAALALGKSCRQYDVDSLAALADLRHHSDNLVRLAATAALREASERHKKEAEVSNP